MKKRILLLGMILSMVFLVACGQKEVPPPNENIVRADIENHIKANDYNFDSISDFSATLSQINNEDVEKLQGKYTSPLPTQKFDISLKIDTMDLTANAKYASVYVLFDKEWKFSFAYQVDKENWQEIPKTSVPTRQILEDIKKVEIEGFKTGFIGDSENTTIRILNRNTDLKTFQDNVIFETTVKTDFATFTFSSTGIYYFKNGNWEVGQIQPDNVAKWKVNYYENKKPEAPLVDDVFKKLTDKEQTLTYIANPDFLEKSYLSEPTEKVGQNSVTFDYIFIATYKNIGDIQYIISVPFDWIGGEWSIGEIKTEYIRSTLKPILGKWYAGDKKYFDFTEVEGDLISGKYFIETEDGIKEEYKIKLKLIPLLKDNDWTLNIESVNIPDGMTSHFDIKNATIDLKTSSIIANNQRYEKNEMPEEITGPVIGGDEQANEKENKEASLERENAENNSSIKTDQEKNVKETQDNKKMKNR